MRSNSDVSIKPLKHHLCNFSEGLSKYFLSDSLEFSNIPARKKPHLSSSRDVFFYIRMPYEIFFEFESGFESRVYDRKSRQEILDSATDDRVVRASEHQCFDIRIELAQVFLYHGSGLWSILMSKLDGRNEIWCGYFLDVYGIVMKMHPILVGSDIDRGLCGENPDFPVACFKYFLGSRDGDSEYLPIRENYLLEMSDGMGGCGIAREYDDGGSLFEEEPDPFFRVFAYRFV